MKDLIKSFILTITGSIIAVVLIFIFFRIFNLEIPKNNTENFLSKRGIIYTILLAKKIIPIVEEISFRLCLKYSLLNFSLTISFLGFVISSVFFTGSFEERSFFLTRIFCFVFLGLCPYIYLTKYWKKENYLKRIWKYNFMKIFYFLTILFGFYHIVNFDINIKLLLFTPILTLPQVTVGIILGYIRLKHGIGYSIILHSLHNTLPYLIDYFFE